MDIIYDILVSNKVKEYVEGKIVGHVELTDDLNLEVHINDNVFEFKSIEGLFDYLDENNYRIIDVQGDIYTREIHVESVKMLSRIGIGYYFR